MNIFFFISTINGGAFYGVNKDQKQKGRENFPALYVSHDSLEVKI